MSTNFKEFSLDLSGSAKKLAEEELSKFIRLIALEALRRIVMRTPVDTGRARGNWDLSVGAPVAGIVGGNMGSGDPVSSGMSKLPATVTTEMTIYITNNVPYILALENGHSGQAPQGMVALTIRELEEMVSQ
jgi:hypothetical protein